VSGPVHRYFFVHLQKTAGTALFRRLRHQFGTEAVYPRPDEQGTPEVVLDVELLAKRLAELGPRTEVVTGHFPLCTIDGLEGRFTTFTVVRDPVERALSFLRHQREVEPSLAGADLERIYDDPVSHTGLLTNHMTRMLSLRWEEMTDGALTPIEVDDGRVDTACHNLEHRIAVMGLQEHFEAFCSDLEAEFGWDLGPPLFMNRTSPVDATDALRERIRTDNRADVRLHEFAVELWNRRHPRVAATPG
jgi:hypothetical protein